MPLVWRNLQVRILNVRFIKLKLKLENVIPIAVSTEKRRSRSYLKYAAIAVLGLAIAGAVYTNQYVNTIEEHNIAAQEQAHEHVDKKFKKRLLLFQIRYLLLP